MAAASSCRRRPRALAAALDELLADPALRDSHRQPGVRLQPSDGLVRRRCRVSRSLRASWRWAKSPMPYPALRRPSVSDQAPLHPISRRSTSRHDRRRSGSCSTRSGHGPTRPMAIASTTSPEHSRWTCSTAERSAGWRWRRAPGEASASSRTPSTRRAAASGTSARVDGAWIGGLGSDDSFGRAMLALGETIGPRRTRARRRCRSPRSGGRCRRPPRSPRRGREASVILGCDAAIRSAPTRADRPGADAHAASPPDCTTGSATRDARLAVAGGVVTYENALLPRALIVAGRRLGSDADGRRSACRSLDWLIDVQTSPDGHLLADRQRLVAARRREVAVRPAADRGDGAPARRRGGATTVTGDRAIDAAMERCICVVPGRGTISALDDGRSRPAAPAATASRRRASTRTRAPSRR